MRDRILTSEQVARILQVHPFTVLKYIKQGKLKGSKLGRMYRIRESDVEQFLNKLLAPSSLKSSQSPTNSTVAPDLPAEQNQTTDPDADQNFLLD